MHISFFFVPLRRKRKKKGFIMMTTVQMPTQQVSAVDAIWSLVQCQTKSVQKALIKRFVALDKEQALQARLDAARQEIANGNCTTCNTQDELDNFLKSL